MANLRIFWTSLTFHLSAQSLTFCIVLSDIFMPCSEIVLPRNSTFSICKQFFFKFILNLGLSNQDSNSYTRTTNLSTFSAYISMSLRYNMTTLTDRSWKVLSTIGWNASGVLYRPNGITLLSYYPNLVKNAIIPLASSAIWTRWYSF